MITLCKQELAKQTYYRAHYMRGKKKEKLCKIKKEAICLKIHQITHVIPHKSSKS